MSKFEFKRGKRFKIDDTFFKDDFDITGIEDNIYIIKWQKQWLEM